MDKMKTDAFKQQLICDIILLELKIKKNYMRRCGMTNFKQMGLLGSVIVTIVMALALLITLLPHLFGMTISIVKDNDMQPTYPKGSLIFVRQVEPESIYVGEVVTYYVNQGESIQTRRVVAKEKNHVFYTKGDGNEQMEIGYVSSRNLIGQPVIHLPYLGHFVSRELLDLVQQIFWLIAGFITLTTIWHLVEHVIHNRQVRDY